MDEGIGVGEGAAGPVRTQQSLPALPDARSSGDEGGDQVGLHAPIVPRLSGVGSASLGLVCAPVGGVRPGPYHVIEALSAARSVAEVISFHSLTRKGLPLEKFTRDSS